tara:strand:- start:129 stop:305 length:177 start_codon:yes stop_codon:yes gene_type:complete
MKEALIKSLVILVPSYTMAVLTEKMVYVLPMVVVCGMIAMVIVPDTKKRIDDDVGEEG